MLYKDFSMIEAANGDGDYPETINDPVTGEPTLTMGYVHTDGWRGYHEATAMPDSDWVKLPDEGSWVTGDWDDAPEEARSSNVEAKLEAMGAERDAFVVFAPSSNVFSTVYDVFVRKADAIEEAA